VKTMSTLCPICGRAFQRGDMVKTAVVELPFGLVGMSFHEACFDGEEARAQQLIQEAVEKAMALARGCSSPTPLTIH